MSEAKPEETTTGTALEGMVNSDSYVAVCPGCSADPQFALEPPSTASPEKLFCSASMTTAPPSPQNGSFGSWPLFLASTVRIHFSPNCSQPTGFIVR